MIAEKKHPRLDLRGLPVWERPNLVFESFDHLPAGDTMTFVTENEPRGLGARILQARRLEMLLDARRVGDREWHVTLTRTQVDDASSQTPEGALARCTPFASLDEHARARIASASSTQILRRGQTVVSENTEWRFLGIVTDGVLSVSSGQSTQRERGFYEVFPHEVFGETEFFDGALALGRVSALSKSARFVKIPRDVVEAVALMHPRLLLELGEVCAQRVRSLAEALAAQATTPILARIAQVLLPYAVPEEGLVAAQPTLSNVTQAQMAASAGTVKEVAARAIADLENRGLLRRERGHVRYLDRQGLVNLIRDLIT